MDRYEGLRLADQWGEKIPIGVLYRNDALPCRETKKIFREQLLGEAIKGHLSMECVMMN